MPKKEIKARVALHFQAGYNIPDSFDGVEVTLSWKRGSKPANRGSSKKAAVRRGRLVLSDEARFPVVTLQYDEKTKKIGGKKLDLLIQPVDKDKEKELGVLKGAYDLGTCGTHGTHENIQVELKPSKKDKKGGDKLPGVKMRVEVEWVVMDKKAVFVIPEGKAAPDGAVTVGNLVFGLESMSESMAADMEDNTTLATDMSEMSEVSDLSDEDDEDDDDDDGGGKPSKGSSRKASASKKSPLAGKSSAKSKATSSASTLPTDSASKRSGDLAKASTSLAKVSLDESSPQKKKTESATSAAASKKEKDVGPAAKKEPSSSGASSSGDLKPLKSSSTAGKKSSSSDLKSESPIKSSAGEKKPTLDDGTTPSEPKAVKPLSGLAAARKAASVNEPTSATTTASPRGGSKEPLSPRSGVDAGVLDELRSQVREQNSEIRRLTEELDRAKVAALSAAAAASSSSASQSTSSQVKELNARLEEMGALLNRFRGEKAEVEDELHSLKTKLLNLEEAQSAAAAEVAEARSRETEVRDKWRKSVAKKKELEDQVAKLSAAAAVASTTASSGGKSADKTRVAQLESQVASLEKQLTDAQSKSKTNEQREAVASKKELQSLTDELDGVRRELFQKKQQIVDLEANLKKTERQLRDRTDELTRANAALAAAKSAPSSNSAASASAAAAAAAAAAVATSIAQQTSSKSGKDTDESSAQCEELQEQVRTLKERLSRQKLFDRCIYGMQAEYSQGANESARELFQNLLAKDAFNEAEPNMELLDAMLAALTRSTELASDEDEGALVRWLSYLTCFHEMLENELGTSPDPLRGDIPNKGIDVEADHPERDVADSDPLAGFFVRLETIILQVYRKLVHSQRPRLETALGGLLAPLDVAQRGAPPRIVNALLVEFLQRIFEKLQDHCVFDSIVRQFMAQVFAGITAHLFNRLVRERGLCTSVNGFRIKMAVSVFEEWANKTNRKLLAAAAEQLTPCLGAANVLVVDKRVFAEPDAVMDMFPGMNPVRVLELLLRFSPDAMANAPVDPDVIQIFQAFVKKNRKNISGRLEIDPDELIRVKEQ